MLTKIKQFNKWYIEHYGSVISTDNNKIVLILGFPFAVMFFTILGFILFIISFIAIPFLLLFQLIEHLSDRYLTEFLFDKRKKKFFKWLEKEQVRLDKEVLLQFRNIESLPKHNINPPSILDLNINHDTVIMYTSILQCNRHKRRSIGDLYMIHKFYNPSTTLKEVLKAYIHAIENYQIGGCYCNEIKKYVFTHNRHPSTVNVKNITEYKGNPTFQEVIKYFKS